MKRGPMRIDTMSATSAAMRTRLTAPHSRERLGDDLEPDRARALDEHDVPRLELRRARARGSSRGPRGSGPGRAHDVRRVVAAPSRRRANTMSDTEVADEPPDLVVVSGRVLTELSHLAEDRDRPATGGALDEVTASAARIATGFAFHASLIRRPPPGSSLSCERQRENDTSTTPSGQRARRAPRTR